jgi:hypothetical protein
MTNEQAKPTAGEWVVNPQTPNTVRTQDGCVSVSWSSTDGTREAAAEANARLIADAGTTYNRTGMTPSELAELVGELREVAEMAEAEYAAAAKRLVALDNTMPETQRKIMLGDIQERWNRARAALAKAKAVTTTTDDKA